MLNIFPSTAVRVMGSYGRDNRAVEARTAYAVPVSSVGLEDPLPGLRPRRYLPCGPVPLILH